MKKPLLNPDFDKLSGSIFDLNVGNLESGDIPLHGFYRNITIVVGWTGTPGNLNLVIQGGVAIQPYRYGPVSPAYTDSGLFTINACVEWMKFDATGTTWDGNLVIDYLAKVIEPGV